MFSNDIFLCAKIDDTQGLLEVIEDIDPNQTDDKGESLLHYTVKFNSLEFARLLLAHKANPNIKNQKGDTPLMLACKMGKEAFIKLLLRYEANVNDYNKYGESALHMAILNGNLDIIKLLITEKTNLKALAENTKSISHYAVKSGKIQVLKFIIEKCNNNINEKDDLGNSMLHYACEINNYDIVEYLIKMNASVHVRNQQGETPLFSAVRYSSLNIVDYLIASGAVANVSNIFSETVSQVSREDIKQYIDSLEYNIEYTKRLNDYPLHIAVITLNYSEVSRLIIQGYKYNKKDSYGRTPQDYALDINDEKILKILNTKRA